MSDSPDTFLQWNLMNTLQFHSFVLRFLEVEISVASCSILLFRFLISARNSSMWMPRISSRFTPLSSTRMASRVRSDTLRAPVTEHIRLKARYSSSERRTLIILLRGLRTVIVCMPV